MKPARLYVLDLRGKGAGGHTFSAALPSSPRGVCRSHSPAPKPGTLLHRDRGPDRWQQLLGKPHGSAPTPHLPPQSLDGWWPA